MPISRSDKKIIIITSGDPSGIGPEITLKALSSKKISKKISKVVIGDLAVFRKQKKNNKFYSDKVHFIDVKNVNMKHFRYGASRASFGKAAMEYLSLGTSLALIKKNARLVTAPINKEAIKKAGYNYEGHTEYLSHATGKDATMMLVGGGLRVSLVTRHVTLKKVAQKITISKIVKTTFDTNAALKNYFGIRKPKIGVAGLNPHASSSGGLGTEERKAIVPAIKLLKKRGILATGPVPADTLFYKARLGEFDGCVSMYHDQGLAPLKMLAFESGVNMSLGLPFLRTSPDHGTAFNIAGKGIASPKSMIEAIRLAETL